jgi:hypothetical protein
MNCQEFWNTMPELARNLDHAHLADCPSCALRLRRERELEAGLRAVASGLRRLEAPPRVEARLIASFRTQSGTQPLHDRRRWIPWLTWAAAFAAMLTLGIFLLRERQPEAARTPPSRAIERAALEAPPEFEGFIPLPDTEAIPVNEDMDVVHVEVPRSAMLAVGLEAGADRAEEMVEADIMLGSDGVARAVRFVD